MTSIYHITHLRNLSVIIEEGGLYCDKMIAMKRLGVLGIAHNHIKLRRSRRQVEVCRAGTLSDYVPFYFAPRSPMLCAIHNRNVENYSEGQDQVLHLVSTAEDAALAGADYCFTEGHAEMIFSDFFVDLRDLHRVDWKTMQSRYWFDTPEDPDRKRRRQAEFLVHQFFPWKLISKIGVLDSVAAAKTAEVIAKCEHKPNVVIERQWYY